MGMEAGYTESGNCHDNTLRVSGLRKGEWSDAEIFYRGNGEVIGASKIDEKLLEN